MGTADHIPNVRRLAIAAISGAGLAACAHAEIPYDLSAITGAAAPVHRKRVAVLPLVDGRTAEDGSDDAEAFVYRGVDYEHTSLSRLKGGALHQITELMAAHLAQAHVFQRVVLV